MLLWKVQIWGVCATAPSFYIFIIAFLTLLNSRLVKDMSDILF